MAPSAQLTVPRTTVVKLWLHQQGLLAPRVTARLTRETLVDHLERTGALQIDSVNVLDRAHYLTLWSRFGAYDREQLDGWIYDHRLAYEYWGHEASILPISHLPLGRRRMRLFPPLRWTSSKWWQVYQTTPASKRRVLRRLREDGPLESNAFESREGAGEEDVMGGWGGSLTREDKRSLKLLWHDGRVAVHARRHFRCVYDLAERVYPQVEPATRAAYLESWLRTGLSGNGAVSERHLDNYFTAPSPSAEERRKLLARALAKKQVVACHVEGMRGTYYALPEHVELLRDPSSLPEPEGTTLICPFDSLLWQRKRAADLLGFEYRVEIYVPAKKRRFGYYVMPILHHGRLVGRLDPKLHRDQERLEVRALFLEPGQRRAQALKRGLGEALESLAAFVGARRIELPRGWRSFV